MVGSRRPTSPKYAVTSSPSRPIQATGRDAKGRRPYRYHARFREVCESTKYEHDDCGALTLAAYSWTVRDCVLLKKFLMSAWTATLAALVV